MSENFHIKILARRLTIYIHPFIWFAIPKIGEGAIMTDHYCEKMMQILCFTIAIDI